MIGLALLVALQADPPAQLDAANDAVDTEIVVIGQRLRDWRGTWRLEQGKVVCKTRRSTGDEAIDAVGCNAMVACMEPLTAQFVALAEQDLPKRETRNRLNALLEAADVTQCLTTEREAGIAALAAARRGASL